MTFEGGHFESIYAQIRETENMSREAILTALEHEHTQAPEDTTDRILSTLQARKQAPDN